MPSFREEVLRRTDRDVELSKGQLRALLKMLRQAQRDVNTRLLDTPETDWKLTRLSVVRARIARVIADLDARLRGEVIGLTDRAWHDGATLNDELLEKFAGERMLLNIEPSVAGLADLQSLSADQITDVPAKVFEDVTRQVRMGMLGGASPSEVVDNIGRKLVDADGNPLPGIWGTSARRAEIVYRTEMSRALNSGTQARMEQTAKRHPDMRKRWIHAGVDNVKEPRPSHLRMERDTAPGGVLGPIPVDQDYVLEGMFPCKQPHDPRLPASHVVNCKCRSVDWFPEFEGLFDD